jgi:hypothetical protein
MRTPETQPESQAAPQSDLHADSNIRSPSQLSSTQLTSASFKESLRLFAPVCRQIWFWLLLLNLVQLGSTQISTYALDQLRQSGREDLGMIASIAGIELVFTLVWSSFWVLVVSLAAQRILEPTNPIVNQKQRHLPSTINQILIEQTRVLAAILWRVPIVIPAGVQWVRLTLVPFVVIFDPQYDLGERDALSRSRELSLKHFWLLNLYLLVAAILPWIVDSATQGESQWIWENPVHVLVGSMLTLLINIATGLFLFSLYRRLAHGTVHPTPAAPAAA